MYQVFNSNCIFLLIFLMSINIGQAQPPPLDEHKTIRTESLWNYPIQEGAVQETPYLSARNQYDREGRLLKSTTFEMDGTTIRHEYHYRYSEGRRERFRHLLDGSELVDQVELYNAEEQLTARINYNHKGMPENRLTIKYNSEGKKLEERYFENQDGQLKAVHATQYSYNYLESGVSVRARYDNYAQNIHHNVAANLGKNDRLESHKIYAVEGNLLQTTLLDYNTQGRLIAKQLMRGDDTIVATCEYEYEGAKMYETIYESDRRQLVERTLHQYEYYQ